jgi:hypothetical protein
MQNISERHNSCQPILNFKNKYGQKEHLFEKRLQLTTLVYTAHAKTNKAV